MIASDDLADFEMPLGIRLSTDERASIFHFTLVDPQTSKWIWETIFLSDVSKVSLKFIENRQLFVASGDKEAITKYLLAADRHCLTMPICFS